MCPSTINLHNFWQEFEFLINVLYSSIGYEKNYEKGRSTKGVSRTTKMCKNSLATKFIKCVLWNDKSTPLKSKKLSHFCCFTLSNAINQILLNVLLLLGYANLSSKKNLLYYHFQIFCMEKLNHYTNNIYVSRLHHPI